MKLKTQCTIVLAAVLASGSAVAAKPQQSEWVELRAGPMDRLSCRVANHTNADLEILLQLCVAPSNNTAPADCIDIGPEADPGTLSPGHYHPEVAIKIEEGQSVSCRFAYLGFPGDAGGVACGGDYASTDSSCMPLQAP